MSFIKRAMLYISRNRGKTCSLFLLIFITAVFLTACFEILKASQNLSEDIRTSLGAAFYIRAAIEVSADGNNQAEARKNTIHISQKEIDQIMETGNIRYCNPVNYGFAKSNSLQFIPGDKHTAESNMGKVTALRFSALASDFADNTASLTEGTHLTENDSRKILISKQLADANHISAGDHLTLTHAGFGERDGMYIDTIPVKTAFVQVEVSGIYQRNNPRPSAAPTAGVAENEIYASLDVLNELRESRAGIYTGEVDFYITDPAELNSIIRKVQLLPSIDWTRHFIRANDFQYSKITDQLSSLGDLVKMLLFFVSAAAAAILTLLLTMRIHNRMREAGILLAAGILKHRIIAGFLTEVLSVAVIALIASYIVSIGSAGFLEHSLFHELPLHLLNDQMLNDQMLTAGTKNEIQMVHYLELSGIETALIYLFQLIVIAASTIVSSVMIMRLKPNEILTKIS